MSSLERQLDAARYSMFICKHQRQRPEHLASALQRHPHCYGWKFVHLYKWDEIPDHFRAVYLVVMRHGSWLDGTVSGTYSLTLHGKGEKFGQFDAKKVKYLAGCSLSVSLQKGIRVFDTRSNIAPFLAMLKTARQYNRGYEPNEDLPPVKKRSRTMQDFDSSYSVY